MKGFIEITDTDGIKRLINVNHIQEVTDDKIYLRNNVSIRHKELYDKIKLKLLEAIYDVSFLEEEIAGVEIIPITTRLDELHMQKKER